MQLLGGRSCAIGAPNLTESGALSFPPRPHWSAADNADVEQRAESILRAMTLEEKSLSSAASMIDKRL
jgi:hypothetical protein